MTMERACNLDVPTGATPMTIADAILRELDSETLEEVLYYIDCFIKRHKEGSESECLHTDMISAHTSAV